MSANDAGGDNVKTDVENLTVVGSGNANVTGSAVANVLTGGDGNDELHGGNGIDVAERRRRQRHARRRRDGR